MALGTPQNPPVEASCDLLGDSAPSHLSPPTSVDWPGPARGMRLSLRERLKQVHLGAAFLLAVAARAAAAGVFWMVHSAKTARLRQLCDLAIRRLEAVRRVSDAVLPAMDLDSLLTTVAQELRRLADVDAVAVLLVAEGNLVRRAVAGLPAEALSDPPLPVCQGAAGRAVATGEPTFDLGPAEEADAAGPTAARLGLHAIAVIPMRARAAAIGVVVLLARRPRALSGDEQTSLTAAANQAATAVAAAQLYHEERRLREELSAVIEAMAEGVTIADRAGNIVLVNRTGRSILGLGPPTEGPQSVKEYRALDLRLPDGRLLAESEWPINQALQGEPFADYEVVLTRRDGTTRQVAFSGGSVRDEAGEVVLGVTVYHDVTELRALERSREELLSLVSHDLRAPLTVTQVRAQRLLRSGVDRAVARDAQAILTSARRMNAIIQDLIDLPSLETGQVRLRRRPVRLQTFLPELVDRLVPAAQAERIQIDVPEDIPEVPADPDRLERALTNLLTNALKYSAPRRPIVVKAVRHADEVVISVTDEGPGIPAEEVPHLFDRYYRAKTGLHVEGVGLGLYISKQLVEAHGGRIWVESRPGEGSTFSFSLPLRPESSSMGSGS